MQTKITQLVLVILLGSFAVKAQISDRKAEKEKKRVEREKINFAPFYSGSGCLAILFSFRV